MKRFLQTHFPALATRGGMFKRRLKGAFCSKPLDRVFNDVYQKNAWNSPESVSGPGSEISQTEILRESLGSLLRDLKPRSMLDAPCGDFNWLSKLELPLDNYLGVDIVPDLIARNRERYARPGRDFQTADITTAALPRMDLILCRDCLVHLSLGLALKAIRNFQASRATYLLITTFPATTKNAELEVVSGKWRPLNMELPPFSFPPPLRLLSEKCTELAGSHVDKALGLWEVSALQRAWSFRQYARRVLWGPEAL